MSEKYTMTEMAAMLSVVAIRKLLIEKNIISFDDYANAYIETVKASPIPDDFKKVLIEEFSKQEEEL